MIEDKKDGIKIAENPTEVLWNNVVKMSEASIKSLESEMTVQKAILEMGRQKLNGLKASPPYV